MRKGLLITAGVLFLASIVALVVHKNSNSTKSDAGSSAAQHQPGSAPKAMTFNVGEVTPYPLKQGGWSEYLNVPGNERFDFNWQSGGSLLIEIDGAVFEAVWVGGQDGHYSISKVTAIGNTPISALPLGHRFRFMMAPSSPVVFTTVDITPL